MSMPNPATKTRVAAKHATAEPFVDGRGNWRVSFRAELSQAAAVDRWGRVLLLMAIIHLATFVVCQVLYDPKIESDPRHLAVWVVDLVGAWLVLRLVAGRWWYAAQSAPGVVMRIWVTFFILAFNSVLMNVQSGWSIHWYRLAWPTLATFGFATLAWLVDLRFLIPAIQMWVTGLLIVRFPHWAYTIYGVSWSAALSTIGIVLERRRA